MENKQILKIGGSIAAIIVVYLIVNSMFKKSSEENLVKNYGKYFNSEYWKNELKRVYRSDFKKWRERGASEQDIFVHITAQYFDRDRLRGIAQVIADAKGRFSDDEIKALAAISEVNNMMDLSYLSTIFSTMPQFTGKTDEVTNFLLNPAGYVFEVFVGSGDQLNPSDRNMLNFILTYFNKKHRKAFVKLLGKMKKRTEKKLITEPF